MERIVINDFNLQDYEINYRLVKVRALLFQDDKILVSKYGTATLLPGGKVDNGESIEQGLVRELKEETGITYNINELNKLFLLQYYQKNYPTRHKEILNRLIETYFYYGNFKGINPNEIKYSKNEIEGNFHLELLTYDELQKRITETCIDPRDIFFNREMDTAVKVYLKKMI